ncbi:hypothetical protein TNCV_3795631 [Trichonephila clavipes]|nr:hypothetical protein TNCV_3795631 [Trichonephila clavipes]
MIVPSDRLFRDGTGSSRGGNGGKQNKRNPDPEKNSRKIKQSTLLLLLKYYTLAVERKIRLDSLFSEAA